MRPSIPLITLLLAMPLLAQDQAVNPTEELRNTVREWVETMRKVQQEENDWARDQEVLQHYREGLGSEIASLKEQIAAAEERQQGVDSETLDKERQRDDYVAAKDGLVLGVRKLEQELAAKLAYFPPPLRDEPRVAQWVGELQQALKLPEDQRGENVSRRLMNVINLVSEAEKFQATVHVREELRQQEGGAEYNMQMVYFGLACAYGVSADGGFSVAGRPGADGWKFVERPDLAARIRALVDAIHGDVDASFINLPLIEP